MERFIRNLKAQAEENPLAAIAIGLVVATTATKLMQTGVAAHNSRVWAREVARRSAMKS